MKRILIAIPCKNDIEADTFKSIYDLIIPPDVHTTFQYFYGYAVDQVRNLIADWTIKGGYDYLFAVDHDITFPPDTLIRLLNHNKDIVSGVYRQRLEPPAVEVYDHNFRNIPYDMLMHPSTPPLVDVGGCGFGCALVKREVFEAVGYPQFVYHQALSHADTFSEDLDFCKKAGQKGYTVWCDTTLMCGHIGQRTFECTRIPFDPSYYETSEDNVKNTLRTLYNQRHLPGEHKQYLMDLSKEIQPKVIYDIGSNLVHWTHEAEHAWPNAKYVLFDGMEELGFLYREKKDVDYAIAVLSHTDDEEVTFFQNPLAPAGNSLYHENPELSPAAEGFTAVTKRTKTLDTVVREMGFPLPDLIKIDVQGAEIDILVGAKNTLQSCRDIIVEMQHDEYNVGAPSKQEVTEYLEGLGFKLVNNICKQKHDGDYHFRRWGAAPTKAYIIWCDHPKSIEYREQAAKSCEAIGLPYEFYQGPYHKTADELWSNDEYVKNYLQNMIPPAASATAAHMNVWKLIAERRECAVILEHDALMLHPVQDMFIPDDMIVNLGYKLKDPTRYDHEAAGPPEEIITITEQHGCHSYIITHVTAENLLEEVSVSGVLVAIDNSHFMRDDPKFRSYMSMGMMSPTPAITCPRESTIWGDESLEVNAPFIDSFKNHLKS